jgi:hypothetical protein
MIFPDAWEEYVRPIPVEERGNFIKAYYKRLTGDDPAVQQECASAWSKWGISSYLFNPMDFSIYLSIQPNQRITSRMCHV